MELWNRLKRSTIIMLLLIVTILGAAAYAAFSQQVPSITIPANGPQTTSNCATLANETKPTPITGAVLFGCGSAPGTAAFTVNYPSQNIPTFALAVPSGSSAFLHYVSTITACTTTLNSGNMTSTVSINFASAGSFFYCETYYNYPPVGAVQGTFSVTWSP